MAKRTFFPEAIDSGRGRTLSTIWLTIVEVIRSIGILSAAQVLF
jgi:hypothetical protein